MAKERSLGGFGPWSSTGPSNAPTFFIDGCPIEPPPDQRPG
jgi:hypothetical protein